MKTTGNASFDLYDVEAIGGGFRNGSIEAPGKIADVVNGGVKVKVYLKSNPELTAETFIKMDYKSVYACSFSGTAGSSGFFGNKGKSGSQGSSNNGLGGNGTDGYDATDGRNGTNGRDGIHVDVYAKAEKNVKLGIAFVQVKVVANGKEFFYKYNAAGGGITIYSNGGSGGDGGRGGNGGSGGWGGGGYSGTGGNGGKGGNGGNGGDGGDGANGGTLTLHIDPSAKQYLESIKLVNAGGRGGSGGREGNAGSGGSAGSGDKHGQRGQRGNKGNSGDAGQTGQYGPKPQIKHESVTW